MRSAVLEGGLEQHQPKAASRRLKILTRQRVVVTILGLAISAVSLYLVTRKISLSEVQRSLSAADWWWVVPSVAATYATVLLRAFRWRLLFRDPACVSFAGSLGAVNVGLLFNSILPARAGEIPRTLALRRDSGVSAFEIGGTIVIERAFDLFAVALFGLVLAPFFPSRSWIHALVLVCAAAVVACAALGVGLVWQRRRVAIVFGWIAKRTPLARSGRATSAIQALVDGAAVLRHPGRLVQCGLVSIVIWIVAGIAGLALFPAFHLPVDTLSPWLLLVANSLALTIPSSPGTIGVYEASVKVSLVAYGVAPGAALSFAVVLHAVNFFPVVASGALASWWMMRRHARRRAELE